MKKTIFLLTLISLLLILNGCAKKYHATIKVTNTGNISTLVMIDDAQGIIPQTFSYQIDPGEYKVLDLEWSYKEELIINFMANALKYDDYYYNEIITMRDGDYIERTVDFNVVIENKE